SVQGAFFGESMFHRVPDASKVALVELVNRLNNRGFRLLDIQFVNNHLKQFGAIEIPRRKYMHLLKQALSVDAKFL
ncbi:MAG: leucyl/phenylalanyl-tRNA--protein transferase, partial [Verrucomicrobia bacterium]|nr:leucyl/phenylalanyl-tRNA--protein transferase [Verrucomicrobiota bacterium]